MSRQPSADTPEPSRTDELLRELRDVPRSLPPRAHADARAAFVNAFEPVRWYAPLLSFVTRASLPVVLTSIVVVYLSWAFVTASTLMQ